MKRYIFFIFIFFVSIGAIQELKSQEFIIAIQSSTKIVYKFSKTDGSLLNSNFINLNGLNSSTPKSACQVGQTIWIANQISNNILIYSLDGVYQNQISGGLDNLRGMNKVGEEVWVTNYGSGNGATANSVARFDTSGVLLGYYPTVTSPFDVIDDGNGTAYISSFSGEGIQKMDYNGNILGTLPNSTAITYYEQLNWNSSGDILAAVYINPNDGLNIISSTDGTVLNFFSGTSSARGCIALDNGNYLVGRGSGVFIVDPNALTVTNVVTGNFQYFAAIDTTLGVDDIENIHEKATLYPNPVTDFIHVTCKKSPQNIQIYDTTGKLLKQFSSTTLENNIDVSSLESGVYILKIIYADTNDSIQWIKK